MISIENGGRCYVVRTRSRFVINEEKKSRMMESFKKRGQEQRHLDLVMPPERKRHETYSHSFLLYFVGLLITSS